MTGDTSGGPYEVADPAGANGMFSVSTSVRHLGSATLEAAFAVT